ncbi:Host cell surface-exposed lipoprotein [Lacicoccus alkaliphilus]|uniref:Uncharacterized protein n=1 Tax=Lacicoccus alkaliphilus DSM 16010 TaxID=1123231 RepID=A0A1M7H7H7_9BACL|nr:hypothetical protein SAMN02745189_01817 [Salinicoccus alkaliphilus DSM 16010]
MIRKIWKGESVINTIIKVLSVALVITVIGAVIFIGFLSTSDETNREIAESFEEDVQSPSPEIREEIYDMMHRMSHQKVRAEDKWGHLKITEDRIEEVISLLEQYNVADRTFYHEAMLDWRDGDFSNAVEVHNRIAQPDNGTVQGQAYGLLSKQEEADYIERHFEETDDIPREEDPGYQDRTTY